MIRVKVKGGFTRLESFLNRMTAGGYFQRVLDTYGRRGVEALSSATPVRSGETAASWTYEIESDGSGAKIVWSNNNTNDGVNIALILQMGHGTGTGGYVEGIDYINPALKPVFDGFAEDLWREVTRA